MVDANENILFDPNLTDKERACFESGIKLGALYHILCGIPVSSNSNIIASIEKGIEAAISCQPYVKFVKVNLDKNRISGNKTTEFDYDEITGKIIDAKILVKYEAVEIIAQIQWIESLQYPLMYIEKIISKD